MNLSTINLIFAYINLIMISLFFWKYNKIAKILNIYDFPNKRKIHSKKTPLIGGMGIFIIINIYFFFFIFTNQNSFYFFEISRNKNLAIYFFLLSFYLVALYDDKFRLRNYLKLILYIVLINFFLDLFPEFKVQMLSFEFLDKSFNLRDFAKLFTLICIITFMTASNMYDGINLNFTIFAVSTFIVFYAISGLLIFLVLILYLGFFSIFNYKGKIFMGETGCIIIAFLIAAYSIYFYHKGFYHAEKIYLIMLLPINDNLRVVVVRLFQGKNAFCADKSHFHHLLYFRLGFKNFLFYQFTFSLLTIYFFLNDLTLYGIIILNLIYLATIYLIKYNNNPSEN